MWNSVPWACSYTVGVLPFFQPEVGGRGKGRCTSIVLSTCFPLGRWRQWKARLSVCGSVNVIMSQRVWGPGMPCAFFMGSAASARPVKKHVHRRIHCHQFLQWYVSLSHTGGSLIPGAAKETWSVNIVEMIRQTQMYAREISRNTYTSMRHYIRAGIVPRFGVIM